MNRKIGYLLTGLALFLLVSACSKDNEQASTTASSSSEQQAAPTTQAQETGTIVSGKVLETLDASGYTYLHLDQGDKQVWVAIPAAKVAVGDDVKVIYSMVMTNFESKALGRTFDEVIFASGFANQEGAPTGTAAGSSSFSEAVQSAGPGSSPVSGGSQAAVVPFSELNVEKAAGENAFTVDELFKKKDELNGQKVLLRGKVVKVSQNIMGKNWIHLQDGTGSPQEKNHDFVVTSDTVPELEKIITVSGVLEADKDYGYGYVYSAIIENASIQE